MTRLIEKNQVKNRGKKLGKPIRKKTYNENGMA